jgi:hypothetical protein
VIQARLCAFIYGGVLVSAPLQAFVFSSYLLNVLLQLANKNGIQNKKAVAANDDNGEVTDKCRKN